MAKKNPLEQLGDMIRDLPGALDDAVTGIEDNLTDILEEGLTNLITSIDDIFKGLMNAIWNIPEHLIEALTKMFRDPKFWTAILIFLTLVTFATGLEAAMAAAPGAKTAAFMKGAGMIYNGWHLDFIVKLHRFAYLVSPKHREVFNELFSDFGDKMNKAGIDLQMAGALFESAAALSDSFGAMIGKDWEASKASWLTQFTKFADVTGERLEKWGKDPELMVDWIDNNIIAPQHNAAAEYMNKLSAGLDKVIKFADDNVKNIRTFRKGLSRVAEDIDDIKGTHYAADLKEGLVDFDTVIFEQWDTTKSRLDELSEILETKIEAATLQSDAGNKLALETGLRDLEKGSRQSRLLLDAYLRSIKK